MEDKQYQECQECEEDFDEQESECCSEETWGNHNRELGMRGEAAAARYLESRGYEIVDMNWECEFGEADIVAFDDETLVFCEVKTRTNVRHGFPAEAVGPHKRARYEKIAACYLKTAQYVDIPVRFDVIALLVVAPDRAMVKHFVNAFGGCC